LSVRLVYCWVEEFRALKNIDINLTNDYKFNFDKDKALLTVGKVDYPSAFDLIKPVKAVIGKNGCGKSSYLDIIEHTLINGRNDFGFCILEKIVNERLIFEIRNLNNDLSFSYEIKDINADFEQNSKPFRLGNNSMGVIKFKNIDSNAISPRNFKSKYHLDISPRPHLHPKRLLNNIFSYNSKKISDKSAVSFVLLQNDMFNMFGSELFEPIFHIIDSKVGIIEDLEKNIIRNKMILSFVIGNRFINRPVSSVERYLSLFVDSDKSIGELDKIIANCNFINDNSFLEFLFDKYFEDGFGVRIRFSLNELNEVEKFLDILNSSRPAESIKNRWENYFDVKMEGISSGEQQILNIGSGLYSDDSRELISNSNSLILLFDEPEAHLHPEWQRTLLKEFLFLIDEVREYYNPSIKIQIIITSHSPFIISDLISENVTFLSNENDFDTLQKDTFASNIHSFLLDGFFMKKTIGEISSDLIEEVVKYLTKNTEGKYIKSTVDCEKVISSVSNIALRNELLKLISQYQGSKAFYLNRKNKLIELLEKEDFDAFENEVRGCNA
jgi:ABC-type multidrug transport system ATPase subunit